jgi:hypothetical protein
MRAIEHNFLNMGMAADQLQGPLAVGLGKPGIIGFARFGGAALAASLEVLCRIDW